MTDEGQRQLKVLDFSVEWYNLEHIPLIQLHFLINRSPPLISLFYQPVPKCRLIKNPASPRGKPRGINHKQFTINTPRCPRSFGLPGWRPGSPWFPPHRVGAARMSRLTWFTLCAITWFTPSVVGVYQKVSSFKCVDTFVNVNPPYAEFSKNQGNLSLGTGFTHSDFFSTKSLT